MSVFCHVNKSQYAKKKNLPSKGFASSREFHEAILIYRVENMRLLKLDIFLAFKETRAIKNSQAPAGPEAKINLSLPSCKRKVWNLGF